MKASIVAAGLLLAAVASTVARGEQSTAPRDAAVVTNQPAATGTPVRDAESSGGSGPVSRAEGFEGAVVSGVVDAEKALAVDDDPDADADQESDGGDAAEESADDEGQVETRDLPSGEDKSGVTSGAISVPTGEGTIDGMGESFSAQLSTGVATFNVPISLLNARGSANPQLALSYSSAGAHGIAGVGWSIGVPFIARQTDRGIPSYDDRAAYHGGQDRFAFNGGQELVPICDVGLAGACSGLDGENALPEGERMPEWASGWMYFRARVEGSFLRFFWSPERDTWRVQSKDGVTMELGVPRDGSEYQGALESNPDAPAQTYRWRLVRKFDTYGERDPVSSELNPVNVVHYRYISNGGAAVLSDIYDTSPASDPHTENLSKYAHHTKLRYADRTDPTFSYRSGFRIEQNLRLVGVDVTSKTYRDGVDEPRALVRRYHFNYDDSLHVSLLKSVEIEGRCSGSENDAPKETGDDPLLSSGTRATTARLSATNCKRLPEMKFEYSHVAGVAQIDGYEPFSTTVETLAESPDHALNEGATDLFDINSDGLPDVLVTDDGLYGANHAVFFNGHAGKAGAFGPPIPLRIDEPMLGSSEKAIGLKNPDVVPLDLDGDGHVNLLHMPGVGEKAYALYHAVEASDGWKWVGREFEPVEGRSAKIDFGSDVRATRTADVNFDGLVDVVVSTGGEIQTFFSLGRYPGGDGQLGHVTYNYAGDVVLSSEPVRTCLPSAGMPVDFGDSEIHLTDMNGDGIVDIAKIQPGRVIYWPGRGNGYFGTGDRDGCEPGTFSQGEYLEMADPPELLAVTGAELRIDDVNGDGLSDLVHVASDAVSIWLNVDGSGWTERALLEDMPANPSFANRVRIADMNGSGTRDIVWGEARNYRYLDLQGGQRPWVLRSVDNGLGKTSTLTYSTSTSEMLRAARGEDRTKQPWSSRMPTVTQIVKSHVEQDNLGTVAGLPERRYVTEYSYRDPVYDGQQREFRGFGHAESTRVGDSNSPTSISASTFLLGECVDEDRTDAVDACSVSERWRDNPREALKGLPVFSETFDAAGKVYLSSKHQGYRLRRLYRGMDGRDVRHAYSERTTSFLYDTSAFVGDVDARSLDTVVVELEPDAAAVGPGPEDTFSATQRATNGAAILESHVTADWFGNQTSSTSLGCSAGEACPTADEVLTQRSVPTLLETPDAWLWRTTESWLEGEASRGASHGPRNKTRSTFNEHGAPVATTAELTGTLELDRFHASGNETAPAPSSSSVDGAIVVSRTHYDGEFGNVDLTRGANGRCASVTFDDAYRLFAAGEAIYPDGCGPLGSEGRPDTSGLYALTMGASYDHGLGAATVVINMQWQPTKVVFDGFGRAVAVYRSHPGASFDPSAPTSNPGAALDPDATVPASGYCALPSVAIEYRLPNETGQQYSVIHTKQQDSVSCGQPTADEEDGYAHAYAFVDGFGRTLVAIAEADPDEVHGDGHDYVVGEVVEYDAKAAVRRKYIPFYWDSDDAFSYPIALSPTELSDTAQYGRQRYDAFGRAIQTYDVDGTITLSSRFHALSTDLWDAADLSPGRHQGSYATSKKDGHGRAVLSVERFHSNGKLEERRVRFDYLPTGEVERIERARDNGAAGVVSRWMRYDSLGRMVLNVEPNTTVNFQAALDADAGSMKAWRYAYNDAGDLVGTSDARGCGVNFEYDGAGRVISEDYSPCESHQALYSPPGVDGELGATGYEVLYRFDGRAPEERLQGLSAPPGMAPISNLHDGQLVAVWDRGSTVYSSYDGRGRAHQTYRRVAVPLQYDAANRLIDATSIDNRYAARWYRQDVRYDSADRPIWATTGAEHPELQAAPAIPPGHDSLGGAGAGSAVTTSYTKRGKVKAVNGSYGPLVRSVTRTADDLVRSIVYGDIAHTQTSYLYDERRRVQTVQTYRGPPSVWNDANTYSPGPAFGSGTAPSTFQLMLQDVDYRYDAVNNPVEIRDWRDPGAWPDSAKPVSRKIQYDDLYRAQRVDYQYASGDDAWTSPFEAENNAPTDDDIDPRRSTPSPHTKFDKRTLWQTFEYDWLGNTAVTQDDANGFYDRSLGTIQNAPGPAAYRMLGAASDSPRAPGTDWLDVRYDAAGSMRAVTVSRGGECLGGECSQHYVYEWDEVGRLSRARRYDAEASVARTYAEAAVERRDVGAYAGAADVELRYTYDGADQRVLKTAVDTNKEESHSLYIFPSLELRRASFGRYGEGDALDYERSALTEVPYLFANGVRLARVVFESIATAVPSLDSGDAEATYERGSRLHVFFELGDHLGSSSLVLDQQTSELVEATTYQAYGATESDYRPDRWANFREDYKFTGKEEDVEVGLQYFGKRYLNPLLGRWVSADPLAVHAPGAANLNLYAYVSGSVLRSTDPLGLCAENETCAEAPSCDSPSADMCADDGNGGQEVNSDEHYREPRNANGSATTADAATSSPEVLAIANTTPDTTGEFDDRDQIIRDYLQKSHGQDDLDLLTYGITGWGVYGDFGIDYTSENVNLKLFHGQAGFGPLGAGGSFETVTLGLGDEDYGRIVASGGKVQAQRGLSPLKDGGFILGWGLEATAIEGGAQFGPDTLNMTAVACGACIGGGVYFMMKQNEDGSESYTISFSGKYEVGGTISFTATADILEEAQPLNDR